MSERERESLVIQFGMKHIYGINLKFNLIKYFLPVVGVVDFLNAAFKSKF